MKKLAFSAKLRKFSVQAAIYTIAFALVIWSLGLMFSSPILPVQAAGPTILTVEKINPNTVEVRFNQAVKQATAGVLTNYSFNGDLSVVGVVQQAVDLYQVSASGEVVPGTTTLTVSANVQNEASEANTDTGPKAIVNPVRIKISELSPEMGPADSEFIEIYNAGGSTVDINGWKVQYSAADAGEWVTLYTVSEATTIPNYSFYLFSTATFDAGSITDGNKNFTAGMALVGGHIRLLNGSDQEIDKIGWGTATSPEGTAITAPIAGQSIERKAFGSSSATNMASGGVDSTLGNSWDSNNNSFDLVIQTSPNSQNLSSAMEQPNYNNFGAGGPMIMHMPINVAPTGAALSAIAQAGDPQTPIAQVMVELHYMTGDGSPTNNTPANYSVYVGAHQSNGYFKFTIPQETIDASTTNGLYYYLKVSTAAGTRYMSASPAADMAGTEAGVAQNPFITNIQNSAGWTKYSISGTITDGTDPVEGALIFIGGTGYSAASGADGAYTLANVKAGESYNISITKTGFYEEWIDNIFLNGNKTGVNKTLSVGTGGGMTGDNQKPMVTWTAPGDNMFGVPTGDANFKIMIGLSKVLDATTFTTTNVILSTDGSTPIAGYSVAYNPTRTGQMPSENTDPYLGVITPPAGGLSANTTYYVSLTGAIRDTAGNAVQGSRSGGGHDISFTTGGNYTTNEDWTNYGMGAMMPPFVSGITPNDGSMNIVPNTKINITFSDVMDPSSVTTSGNIKLYKVTVANNIESTTLIASSITLDSTQKIATITPTGQNLDAGRYRVVVSGALKSANGVWMGDPAQNQNVASYNFYQSHFSVGSNVAADTTHPTILGTWPADGDTDIAVNVGAINIQFSEAMNPSTINSTSVSLKRGSTNVTGSLTYSSMSNSASFVPTVVLATNAVYTLTVSTTVTDVVGNALETNYEATFTTSATGDTQAPSIMFGNGDEYRIAITFSEPMNSAKVTDSSNWSKSVLNPANYEIKWGIPATVAAAGTVINLSNSSFKYEADTNTVIIDSFGLSVGETTSKDYYVTISTATDLSGNAIAGATTTQMPINSSANTNGMLGPMTGGMYSGGTMGPNMGNMGMMMAGAFPMNSMAGQTTMYFVDIPTTKATENGGKIILTFPTGFDVSGAKKDPFSQLNNDINEWNTGTIAFGSAVEDSGGASNDGVTVDAAARAVTITLAVTDTVPTNDYLHLDLAGIKNSSIPRDFNTSGYSVDIKTKKADGTLSETITTMPFFISPGGSSTLSGSITGIAAADVDGTGDTVKVFLGSPMTGPMEAVATIADNGAGTYTFSGLPIGSFMLFTDPTITLDTHDYAGSPFPEPITIAAGANTKDVALVKQAAGAGLAAITVDITGVFGTDDIDVFAGGPTGYKVKTITDADTNPSTTLYLSDGSWMIGMGPAMPKGPMAGPPPMPDWMPPMSVDVKVSGAGTTVTESSGDTANDGTIAFTIASANKQIIGYVQDGAGTAIADAEVFAYQPMNSMGMGAHTKTGTDGKFTLKLAQVGNYSVGVSKMGLPYVPDRSVILAVNVSDDDGNTTADVTVDSKLITGTNKFIFKMKKPPYTISGKLTDGTNPISYAPVWANQTDGYNHADTMTDSSGNFILFVDNGSWTINAYIPGKGDAESQTVVVNGANATQNLAPDTTTTYYTISGTITIGGALQTYMPIRAVQFTDTGGYTGKEFGGSTKSDGTYQISVPGSKKYRVDIWTPDYGEVELDTDEVVNNPANVIVAAANRTDRNITIAADNLKTITIVLSNKNLYSGKSGFLNINGASCSGALCKATGFFKSIRINDISGANQTVQLKANSNYHFSLDVPGYGNYIPILDATSGRDATTDTVIVAAANRNVQFDLPNTATTMETITGNVTDGTNPVAQAWVWVGNPTTGYNNGTQTDANGDYSISVPTGTGYKMGADKPGYMSQEPITKPVSLTQNFTLTKALYIISGYLYKDTNSNNAYDSGEAVANGWVRAGTTDGSKKSQVPADGNGYFELGAVNGTWKIYGMADGYSESLYGSNITVAGANQTEKNIKLTVNASWSNKQKSKPMTPASGGTFDDTATTGTGVKMTIPPNALGSSSSAGNVSSAKTSAVTKTNSSQPFNNQGVSITAVDNSNQPITNLSDYIDLQLILYKADVDSAIAANTITYSKLKATKNSYWNSSLNDWVDLTTTKAAYYKNTDDTDWTMFTVIGAADNFNAFIDTLIAGTTYADYKLVYTSKTNHFTIFGVTTPTDLIAPAVPASLAATVSNGSVALAWTANSEDDLLEYQVFKGTSSGFTCNDASQINTSAVVTNVYTDSTPTDNASYTYYYKITAVDNSGNISACTDAVTAAYTYSTGGGGGIATPSCTSVTYGAYTVACFSGYQYRNVDSRTPVNCTLTAAQQDATKKVCGAVDEALTVTVTGTGLTAEAPTTASFIAREKALVKKISKALVKRLAGRILLQVEEKGEAWYVNPVNGAKYYLGRPADAFAIMRKLSLGINNKNFDSYKGKAPARLAGRILLKVEDHGKAYYVNPVDLKMHYLGRPADAFNIMRTLGLGITNANLRQISVEEVK